MRLRTSTLALCTLLGTSLVGCGDDSSSAGSGGSSAGGSAGSDAGTTGGSAGVAGSGGGAGGAAGAGGNGGVAGSGGTATGGSGGTATGGSGGTATGGSGGSSSLTCLQELDKRGVGYTTTTAKGVVDAVKLTGKLNDVLIASTNTDKVATDPMACKFVLHLWDMAEVLKAHGIHKIGTLGSYCYRCCCYWSATNFCRGPNDPEPDCSVAPWNGYSNHSFGRAVDIRYLYKDSGQVYDVNNPAHWVEWGTASETCTKGLAAQTGISKELYALVCDMAAKHVFGTCLTPNYNSAHRNHFHCDIGQSAEPTTWKVLSSESNVDLGPGDE